MRFKGSCVCTSHFPHASLTYYRLCQAAHSRRWQCMATRSRMRSL